MAQEALHSVLGGLARHQRGVAPLHARLPLSRCACHAARALGAQCRVVGAFRGGLARGGRPPPSRPPSWPRPFSPPVEWGAEIGRGAPPPTAPTNDPPPPPSYPH